MSAPLDSPDLAGGPISAINVTPFVDIALVLLVIFMVTAPALMKDVIGVQLPKASSSETSAAASLSVSITQGGQILLNGKLTLPEELSAAVRQAVQRHPDTQAIISDDENARHGDVVRAIDLIKSAGLNRFAIQVQHRP